MKFLKITSEMLKVEQIYAFAIFLYDPHRSQRIVALHAHSPVTQSLMETWALVEEKGGHLQIDKDEVNSFVIQTETTRERLNEANAFELSMIDLENRRNEIYAPMVEEEFLITTELQNALDKDDFTRIIERSKAEILLYPLTVSSEVSLVTELVEKLFVKDTFLTRATSFTYFYTKMFGIKDIEVISQILLGMMLKDIGLTLINISSLKKVEDLNELDIYQKHPMLSILLLSKHPVDLSKEVKRIILEQHEQIDGEGFPKGKVENYISLNSQIVHMCDHLFKFSHGKIDGKVRDLKSVMKMMSNKNQTKGLVTKFSDPLLDLLKIFSKKEIED